jgi:hypothetical protein
MSMPLPYQPDCADCIRLRASEQSARTEHDPSKATDYRVLARRHLHEEHGIPGMVAGR